MTAYHALATRAALAPGQMLLVLGAGGGVGLAAVQIGKALGGRVIAAASNEDKLRTAQKYGADHLINYEQRAVDDAVKRLTSGAGVDVVFDPVAIGQESGVCTPVPRLRRQTPRCRVRERHHTRLCGKPHSPERLLSDWDSRRRGRPP